MSELTCPACGSSVDGFTQEHLDEAQLNAMHGGMDAGYQAGLAAARRTAESGAPAPLVTTFQDDVWPRRIA